MSVIVPTYQRGPVVAELIAALCRQEYDGAFEVVVIIDGSTDDTEQRLAATSTRFPMRVIWQPNGGLAHARNQGAAAANGEILVFLDDDMEPDAHFLSEHDRSHREGADVVAGAVPLHPDSTRSMLADGVAAWAEARSRRLSGAGYVLRFNEIVSGQVSIRRDVFERLEGFDERFTAGGSYGNEDLDFGHRLLLAGYHPVFNPRAVSRQRYVVTAAAHLRQYADAGQADVALARKYPALLGDVFHGELATSTMHRLMRWPALRFPRVTRAVTGVIRGLVVRRVDAGRRDPLTVRAFFLIRAAYYWTGVQAAGGIPRHRRLRVLCYHAIASLAGNPVMMDYGVPPDRFRAQLETLQRAGYHAVHPDEVARFVDGEGGLPLRALLVTFDDCYTDLVSEAAPILRALAVPAIAFAVSGRLGRTNDWDRWLGASELSLLSAEEVKVLPTSGVEVGGHSRTHSYLGALPDAALHAEIRGCADDLRALGLPRPRFFSYPHGEHDRRVRAAVRDTGYLAAFTTSPGRVGRRTDRYALPRVEIFPADVGWRLRAKVAAAGPLLLALMFAQRVASSLRRRFRALTTRRGEGGTAATRA
jgi:glycosyltransferase involved in cell wall biosynthesis/peptidoglycan/xylan/chitin deacetylase (PgdA/CDA1 family)